MSRPKSVAIASWLIGIMLACPQDLPVHAESRTTLTIAAANSLREPLRKIVPVFEAQHPGVDIRIVYGPSQTLRQHIEEGAPVDLFLPSSFEEIERLEKRGLILNATKREYATTELVVITGAVVPAPVASWQDLTRPEVRRLAVGDPSTSAVGRFTAEFLMTTKLNQRLKSRLVSAEHSQAVLDLVARGEADAGIVYHADATRDPRVRIVATVPADLHAPIRYGPGAVWTAHNGSLPLAQEFGDFFLTPPVQAVLSEHGFHPASADAALARQSK